MSHRASDWESIAISLGDFANHHTIIILGSLWKRDANIRHVRDRFVHTDQITGMQEAGIAVGGRDFVAQLLHITQQGRQELEIQETEDQHRLIRINAS